MERLLPTPEGEEEGEGDESHDIATRHENPEGLSSQPFLNLGVSQRKAFLFSHKRRVLNYAKICTIRKFPAIRWWYM